MSAPACRDLHLRNFAKAPTARSGARSPLFHKTEGNRMTDEIADSFAGVQHRLDPCQGLSAQR